MKKINLIFWTTLLAGCASSDYQTGLSGLTPVKSSVSNNLVYFNDYQPKKIHGRAPASIKQSTPELSNRQIYFLSFYRQFLKLEQSLGMQAKTANCPSFHQVILEYKEKLEAPFDSSVTEQDYRSVRTDMNNLGFYPVLALKSDNSEPLWRDVKARDWKDDNSGMLKQALHAHHADMQNELKQLCESGVSAGYYVYENLVTYFKEYKEFHYSKAGLKALLKVPTLANMVMLDNLSSNSYYLNQENHFDTWLLQRANTQWFSQYRDHLNQKRGQLIEAKLKKGLK
tara:strand:- start:2891 stop:3742 length:852 start_codon:yes stop_codon:yes gene_type:complete